MKRISLLLSLLLCGITTFSQPLPPTTPNGNPVPVDNAQNEIIGFALIIILVVAHFIIEKRSESSLK